MTNRKLLDDWLLANAPVTDDRILPKAKSRAKSPETRAKMSAAKKGKKFTDEHKANISIAQKRRFSNQATSSKD